MKRAGIWALLLLLYGCGADDRQYARVARGAFRTTVTETGSLQAVRYTVVSMPRYPWEYGQPAITALTEEGKQVRAGDVVGQIDTTGVVRGLKQKRAERAIEEANLRQKLAEQQNKTGDLTAKLLNAEAAFARARIDTQRVQFESETRQILSRLNLARAELNLRKLRKQIETARVVQAEERRIQEAKIARIRSDIEVAALTVDRFTLRAPANGMVEYRENRRTRSKVGIGDWVWSGNPIVGLPDLSRMKALTSVAETDINKVEPGQKAFVRLDAFPKFTFEGAVVFISKISRQKDRESRVKIFDVEVLLDGSDPILRPGMTVSCAFLVADLEDALFLDNACIRQEDREYVVYKKGLFGLKRVPVTLGPRNTRGVVVRGDLKEGDRIAVGGKGEA